MATPTTATIPLRARRRALCLLGSALLAGGAAAQMVSPMPSPTPATAPSVTVGGRPLILPAPAGLTNAMPDAPLLEAMLRRSMTGERRMLALFARPQEIAESQVRKSMVRMPVSAVVFTLTSAEDQVVTPQAFLAGQAEMERGFRAAMAAALRAREAAQAARAASATASAAAGAPAANDIAPELLGVLSKSDHHLTMANQASFTRNAGETAQTAYTLTTVVLVRGRLLNMVATYLAPSEAVARAAGGMALQWVEAVTAAN